MERRVGVGVYAEVNTVYIKFSSLTARIGARTIASRSTNKISVCSTKYYYKDSVAAVYRLLSSHNSQARLLKSLAVVAISLIDICSMMSRLMFNIVAQICQYGFVGGANYATAACKMSDWRERCSRCHADVEDNNTMRTVSHYTSRNNF